MLISKKPNRFAEQCFLRWQRRIPHGPCISYLRTLSWFVWYKLNIPVPWILWEWFSDHLRFSTSSLQHLRWTFEELMVGRSPRGSETTVALWRSAWKPGAFSHMKNVQRWFLNGGVLTWIWGFVLKRKGSLKYIYHEGNEDCTKQHVMLAFGVSIRFWKFMSWFWWDWNRFVHFGQETSAKFHVLVLTPRIFF